MCAYAFPCICAGAISQYSTQVHAITTLIFTIKNINGIESNNIWPLNNLESHRAHPGLAMCCQGKITYSFLCACMTEEVIPSQALTIPL